MREPIDLSLRTFTLHLSEDDWIGVCPQDLTKAFTWKEVQAIIQCVQLIEDYVGNDWLGTKLCRDKADADMQTVLRWMTPAGWKPFPTLPGGTGTHGGQAVVNSLYRRAYLWNAIGIILWHRNRYKPVIQPVIGYKIVDGERYHEYYKSPK